MTAPLDPGLIGVALEVEMGDLPEEVRLDVTSIFERRETGLVWNDIPGVLCAVTLYYSGSSSSWSPLHGYFNADLEKFETDFLPFVLARFACKVVRVHLPRTRPLSVERWVWMRGSTVVEMHEILLASQVLLT